IGIWAVWVGQEYLDFDPHVWPIGREFGIQIISHDFWNQIQECGVCAIWNGNINGGSPALADPFGSAFHPFVMISTLLFGIVNGVKVATLLTLWLAGLAQWGIAYLFEGRRIVRLWSGALAVVGGHILGKLELGAFGITLSITMTTLALVSLLYFIKKSNRKSMIIFAFSITMLLLSGHGYMQVGFFFWLPFVFLLVINKQSLAAKKKFAIALILGLLMASIIILPILHFSPRLEKFTDPDSNLIQYFEYMPLNLVIHSWDFYIKDTLDKPPFPYLTNIYIGWVPVIFAILALSLIKDKFKPYFLTLTSFIFLSLFLASGLPFRWAESIIPFVSGIRHTQLIAGLMVSPIIGLASYSLEKLFQFEWPSINLSFPSGKSLFSISVQWLLLAPIIFSIYSCYDFNKEFIKVKNVDDVYQTLSQIKIENTQWFAPPFGDHWWVLASIENDLKVTDIVAPWWWKNRERPKPYLLMTQSNPPDDYLPNSVVDDIPIYINNNSKYASIVSGQTEIPCSANAQGGEITVYCDTDKSGQLIVRENMLVGWKGWRDGVRIGVFGNQWLHVEAPSGKHVYTFRYLPWDVPVGLTLTIVGIFLSIFIWFSPSPRLDKFLS
ncbi:MAG: hypothetical protein MUO54_11420, partial [Anaerolineales bacterium]|nr:hypothetical protein [Anaerolineales bacterium]